VRQEFVLIESKMAMTRSERAGSVSASNIRSTDLIFFTQTASDKLFNTNEPTATDDVATAIGQGSRGSSALK
jgi:hypothetical protein